VNYVKKSDNLKCTLVFHAAFHVKPDGFPDILFYFIKGVAGTGAARQQGGIRAIITACIRYFNYYSFHNPACIKMDFVPAQRCEDSKKSGKWRVDVPHVFRVVNLSIARIKYVFSIFAYSMKFSIEFILNKILGR
jgi:hypothetical protein